MRAYVHGLGIQLHVIDNGLVPVRGGFAVLPLQPVTTRTSAHGAVCRSKNSSIADSLDYCGAACLFRLRRSAIKVGPELWPGMVGDLAAGDQPDFIVGANVVAAPQPRHSGHFGRAAPCRHFNSDLPR